MSSRTLGRFQITTDALRGYVGAIEEYYGSEMMIMHLTQKAYSANVYA